MGDERGASDGPGCLGLLLIVGLIAIVVGGIGDLFGGGDEKDSTPSPSRTATDGPFAATPTSIEALVRDVDAGTDPKAECTGGYCDVSYKVEIVGIDTDYELVLAQSEVWEEMFSDPEFDGGTITLNGPVESIGGKQSVEGILEVSCDRAADKQINWNSVDADGLRALCDWNELVTID